jgi:MraZ protein
VAKNKLKQIMLIGEYTHSIDDKNRLSLPAKFRTELGKKIVVTQGLDNCLWVFKHVEWQKIEEKLNQSSIGQADNRSFNRLMFSSAVEAEVDSIGRILVPEFLRDRANLKNKVVVIGVSSRVEIWNEKTWTDYKKVVEKQADALAEKLGQVGVL